MTETQTYRRNAGDAAGWQADPETVRETETWMETGKGTGTGAGTGAGMETKTEAEPKKGLKRVPKDSAATDPSG